MMFQLALIILKGIMNPDNFTGGKKGSGAEFIRRVAISLVLLTVLVPISIPGAKNEWERQLNNNGLLFGSLYSLQHRILSNNTLGRLVLGTTDSSSTFESGDSDSLDKSSRIFTSTILKGFYRINLLPEDDRPYHEDGKDDATFNDNRVCKDIDDEVLAAYTRLDADPGEIISLINATCEADDDSVGTVQGLIGKVFPKLAGTNRYVFAYMPLVGFIVAVIFVFILLSFTIDVAVRAVKLAVLRLIAPIPIISYMAPNSGKDSAFNAWVKTLTSTYLDLFLRLAVVYFVIFLIQDMIVNGIVINTGTGVIGILSYIIIWIGLFIFAKQSPKFIKQVLGIKDEGGKLFGGFGELAAIGAAGLGTIGSAAANYRASQEENDVLHKGSKTNIFRNAGSAIAGAIGGGYAGIKALGGKDASAKSVLAAQNQRNAMRAAHSTLPGRLQSSAYGMFTGQGLSEKGNLQLKANQDAFKAFKDYKNTLEEEALKKSNFYGQDKSGSGNLYNYEKLRAAVDRARSSGASTFDYNDGIHSYSGLVTDAFDVNTMNDIKSSQAENYAHKLMTDSVFRDSEGTANNSYKSAQTAANNAGNSTFNGEYATTKKAMGEVKTASTGAETDMKDIMRRANDQHKK